MSDNKSQSILKRDLVLFSASYPVNNGETFLANELDVLKLEFNRVIVFCAASGKDWYWKVPPGVEIYQLSHESKLSLRDLFMLFKILMIDFMNGGTEVKTLRENTAILKKQFQIKNKLLGIVSELSLHNPLYYSYWFDEWSSILCLLKLEGVISNFISRAHRFDIFEELRRNGRIPFRTFQLNHIEKVFSVSQMGTNYLKDKYPRYNGKFLTSRLGTFEVGSNFSSPENHIHIVTCSRVVPVKRLGLIVDLLETWKSSLLIKWSHLGDGPDFESLRSRAQHVSDKNDLVEVHFVGHLKNSQVLEFYRNNEITAFVNVSTSEGLPVSLMEAASFGIPLIGTDVGGTKEIVNEYTGVLLDAKPEIDQILESILLVQSKYSCVSERKKIKEYWKAHFSAFDNYHAFVDELKSL